MNEAVRKMDDCLTVCQRKTEQPKNMEIFTLNSLEI